MLEIAFWVIPYRRRIILYFKQVRVKSDQIAIIIMEKTFILEMQQQWTHLELMQF